MERARLPAESKCEGKGQVLKKSEAGKGRRGEVKSRSNLRTEGNRSGETQAKEGDEDEKVASDDTP